MGAFPFLSPQGKERESAQGTRRPRTDVDPEPNPPPRIRRNCPPLNRGSTPPPVRGYFVCKGPSDVGGVKALPGGQTGAGGDVALPFQAAKARGVEATFGPLSGPP